VDLEHPIEIEEFYFKSGSSLRELQEPSTAQQLENEKQLATDLEKTKDTESELKPEVREQQKTDMSERETLAALNKSKLK
jgi:hypothetical protein